MAVLGLRFCARAFSSCGKWGPLFIAVRGPLTITASLVAEHRLQTRRLSSCGSRAQPLRGMWDLPRPGLEPVFPALAGRLPTTAPPGNPTLSTSVTLRNKDSSYQRERREESQLKLSHTDSHVGQGIQQACRREGGARTNFSNFYSHEAWCRKTFGI